MNESIDLSKYSIRTDLAIEAREMVLAGKTVGEEENLSKIEGVIIKEKDVDDIKLSLVEVTKQGEEQLGKKSRPLLNVRGTGDQAAGLRGTTEGARNLCPGVCPFFSWVGN